MEVRRVERYEDVDSEDDCVDNSSYQILLLLVAPIPAEQVVPVLSKCTTVRQGQHADNDVPVTVRRDTVSQLATLNRKSTYRAMKMSQAVLSLLSG